MTDRDDSAGGFLERWSRKKIEAERDEPAAPAEDDAKSEIPPAETGEPKREPDVTDKSPATTAPKAEFDLASLPSLDSITAATDIRGFLAPGVPKELARAALRRAWVADPAIRDFVGLAENDWDFTDPNAMPGFGALPDGYDVKKLVAQIFGHRDQPAEDQSKKEPLAATQPPETMSESSNPPAQTELASIARNQPPGDGADPAGPGQQVAKADFVQRDNNIASHKSIRPDDTTEPKTRRQHGSALPQ
jgi:hypothetical protein